VLEVGKLIAQRSDLARVQRRGRDQHPGRAERQPLAQRLGPEGREQRAEDGAELQRAERRDVELRDAPATREDALAGEHAELREDRGEAARLGGQVRIGEVPARPLAAAPADRAAPAAARGDVPVDRLVGDVEPATVRQAVQRIARG
jgi:hypothetical protein